VGANYSTAATWQRPPLGDLLGCLGKCNVLYERCAYWCVKGNFECLFEGVQRPDMEQVMVNSTCCKAYQAWAGAKKQVLPKLLA
jgi:hypothetical protein